MHKEAHRFIEGVKALYPANFDNREFVALDVGSLDINGSNDDFFSTPTNVFGIDVFAGPSVDRICQAHLFKDETLFRTVICTSMLEHDEHWQASVANMVQLTIPGGLLVITCAGIGYKQHGTPKYPVTCRDGRLLANDHYRNVSIDDLRPLLEPHFEPLHFSSTVHPGDTFFWGVRK